MIGVGPAVNHRIISILLAHKHRCVGVNSFLNNYKKYSSAEKLSLKPLIKCQMQKKTRIISELVENEVLRRFQMEDVHYVY